MTGECALPGEVEEISEENSAWRYRVRMDAQDNIPGAREAEVDALRSRAGDKVSKMDKLRADMLDYQSASPRDVYSRGRGFDADIWRARVQTAETPLALRDLLAELEAALDPSSLCTDFHHFTPFIIPGAYLLVDGDPEAEDDVVVGEEIPIGVHLPQGDLSWLPATTSSVSLRLQSLDAATSFRKGQKPACLKKDSYKYIQRDFAVGDDGTNFTSIAPPGPGFLLPVGDFAKQLRSTGFFQDEEGREIGPSAAAGKEAGDGAKDEDGDGDFYMQEAAEPAAAGEEA